LERVLDTIPDLIMILDNQWRIRKVNQAMADKLGLPAVKIAGKYCYQVVHDSAKPPDFCPLTRLIRDGREHTEEVNEDRLGDNYLVTVSPLHDEKNHLIGAVHIARDISDFKRSQRAAQLRRFSEKLLKYQEQERKHIARELHDHIGQDLVSIKISLQMLERESPDLEEGLRDEIRELVGIADKTISDVRRISATLRPESLDRMGLVPALEHEIDYFSGRGGTDLTFESDNFQARLPPEKEIAIYRIVQEGITNILKHSQAGKARIRLSRRGTKLSLSIKDDGIGFSPGWEKSSPGLGLVGIEERVKGLEGRLKITSRKGKGAEILITLPMKE
jgi:two-component system, NarL family, sensor histidine kinase UhpB